MDSTKSQDYLAGVTLEVLLTELVKHYGWEYLGQMIPVNCFNHDPSMQSSLKFLRRTAWARAKVEQFYIRYKEDQSDDA